MKHNLKNRPNRLKDTDPIYWVDVQKWFEGFEAELRELFKKEHQIAEDNQDLYYDDKLNELEQEILG